MVTEIPDQWESDLGKDLEVHDVPLEDPQLRRLIRGAFGLPDVPPFDAQAGLQDVLRRVRDVELLTAIEKEEFDT